MQAIVDFILELDRLKEFRAANELGIPLVRPIAGPTPVLDPVDAPLAENLGPGLTGGYFQYDPGANTRHRRDGSRARRDAVKVPTTPDAVSIRAWARSRSWGTSTTFSTPASSRSPA